MREITTTRVERLRETEVKVLRYVIMFNTKQAAQKKTNRVKLSIGVSAHYSGVHSFRKPTSQRKPMCLMCREKLRLYRNALQRTTFKSLYERALAGLKLLSHMKIKVKLRCQIRKLMRFRYSLISRERCIKRVALINNFFKVNGVSTLKMTNHFIWFHTTKSLCLG